MGGLLALIPLVTTILPKLMGLFGSPLAGSVLMKVGEAATKIFGTTDPSAIQLQISEDNTKLERFKKEIDAETAAEQAYYADLNSARAQTVALAQTGSAMAWGAPLMTLLVTIGFFGCLAVFAFKNIELPEFQQTVLVALTGALAAGFQQGINYWLGSSRASATKDATLATVVTSAAKVAEDKAADEAAPKMFR